MHRTFEKIILKLFFLIIYGKTLFKISSNFHSIVLDFSFVLNFDGGGRWGLSIQRYHTIKLAINHNWFLIISVTIEVTFSNFCLRKQNNINEIFGQNPLFLNHNHYKISSSFFSVIKSYRFTLFSAGCDLWFLRFQKGHKRRECLLPIISKTKLSFIYPDLSHLSNTAIR